MNRNRPHSTILVILFVSMLAMTPLVYGVWIGLLSNSRGYYEFMFAADNARLVSHQGQIREQTGYIRIGDLKYGNTSQAKLDFNFWEEPTFTQIARSVSKPYLGLVFQNGLSANKVPVIFGGAANLGTEVWGIDQFGPEWNRTLSVIAGTEPAVSISNGTIVLASPFPNGERAFHMYKTALPDISTTRATSLLVTWRSSDHVARLDVSTQSGKDFQVLRQSADGTIYTGTYGGAYSKNWTSTIFGLPPGETLSGLDLGLDNGGGHGGFFPVNGSQHVDFARIWIGNLSILTSSALSVQFNNRTVLHSYLNSLGTNDLYTWDKQIYGDTLTLNLPINASSLALHNYLDVSVGPFAQVELTSATITMLTHTENVTDPYIAGIPAILIIVAAAEGLLVTCYFAFYLVDKMLKMDEMDSSRK